MSCPSESQFRVELDRAQGADLVGRTDAAVGAAGAEAASESFGRGTEECVVGASRSNRYLSTIASVCSGL